MKHVFFLLTMLGTACFADSLAAKEQGEYAIDAVVPRQVGDGTFELCEFVVAVRGPTLNVYRSAEMSLEAEITQPSGRVVRVPGFFSEDFELKDHRGITIEGSSGWRIRFSGDEEGNYRFRVALRVRGETIARADGPSFVLKKSANHGMIRVSKASPRYFEYDDGTAYFAVGQNVCFTSDVPKSLPGAKMRSPDLPWDEAYARWFGKMGGNGANWARIWMKPNFYLETGEPWQWSLENAWRLDEVVELARRNGLHLCLCFNSERNDVGTCYRGTWQGFRASDVAWGELLRSEGKSFADFGTSAAAREMYRDKIRYIVARWGYSPNIFCWELWNEIECIEAPAMNEWSKEMTAFLRQIDPWKHLIKSSGHAPGSKEYWAEDHGDLNDVHGYFGWAGDEEPKDFASFLPKFSAGVRAEKRPFLVGETGIAREVETKYGLAGDLQDRDTGCFSVHEGLWGGLFSGAAGSGMVWWWDEHVDACDGYRHFQAIANFVKDVPFHREAFELRANAAKAPGLKVYELAGQRMRLLWVRQPELNWYSTAIEKKAIAPMVETTLTLRDVRAGSYHVEFWDAERGTMLSSKTLHTETTVLEIPLRDVRTELAIKVRAE
jgi:hypothetical protein